MIDKSLVKRRFQKSLKTYNNNAIVQKITAKKLISLLQDKSYYSILEVGCATGILTEEIKKTIAFDSFDANDIVENSKDFIQNILPNCNFIEGDIEEIILPKKYDLIISNACLQWCNNIEATIDKLLNHLNRGGILAFSIFGENNLIEITDYFGIKNKTYSINSLKENISKYNIINYEEENIKINFENPIDLLRHIKLTGANAIKEITLTKSKLKEFEEKYKKEYSENGKVILTYNPVYIIISSDKD